MRRLAPAVVLAATLGALVVAGYGDAREPGPGAERRQWLGTWDTNFGTLVFDDLHLEASEIPGPNGETQYGWQLNGIWYQRGGQGAVPVSGGVDDEEPGSFSGCWRPPGPIVTRCPSMLIYRYGNRIRGGYWKACGLAENCASHHPWKGTKREARCTANGNAGAPGAARDDFDCPVFQVGFRFKLDGFPDRPAPEKLPDDLVGVQMRTGATKLIGSRSGAGERFGEGEGSIVMTNAYLQPDLQTVERTVVFTVTGGRFAGLSTGAAIEVYAVAVASDDPNCPTGASTTLVLHDRKKTLPGLSMHSFGGPCLAAAMQWQDVSSDDRRALTHVWIGRPKEIG